MQEIKIISKPSKENPFLVIYKPQGLPSAPLSSDDKNNALAIALDLFPEIKNVKGLKEIEYGLLHRIDTQTEGLLLIATNQQFFDSIIKEQAEGKFIKSYEAISQKDFLNSKKLEGFPAIKNSLQKDFENGKTIEISSYFRNFGHGTKSVRPVTEDSGKAALKKIGKLKEYSTKIQLIKKEEEKYYIQCQIKSGYRHQVRCHLAWLGFPIIGDLLYNSNFNDKQMLFKASGLEFTNPITKKKIYITI